MMATVKLHHINEQKSFAMVTYIKTSLGRCSETRKMGNQLFQQDGATPHTAKAVMK